MARVSIIIATYNRADFLGEAIQSALDQHVDDLEVVVVDDGSTDNTREVVNRLADPRVIYLYQENRGATAACNRGIAESTGDYISILGSDDTYIPDALLPLVAELERCPDLGSVSGGFRYVDEEGGFLRESRPWRTFPSLSTETWLFWCPTLLQASVIRRQWLDVVGPFDETLRVTWDWDIGLRLAHAGCQMTWLKSFIFNYRLHRNQDSRDASRIRQDYQRVLDKFFDQTDLPDQVRVQKSHAYAHAYLRGAVHAFEAAQWVDAETDLAKAIELDPHLLDRKGQRIFDLLVGWANDAMAVDPARYIELAFAHLPPTAGVVQRRVKAALASLAMARFFSAYERGDYATVRRSLVKGVVLDPSWLVNRGVLSISARALLAPLLPNTALSGRRVPEVRSP